MATLRKVYRFRLCPTQAQGQAFLSLAGSRRFVFNWALARRKAHYAETQKTLSLKELSAELTALKKQEETAWLKESDSQLLQQALADCDRAFKNFFEKRARFPRFKSKHRDTPAFRIPQRVRADGNRLYVPKVGWVKFRKSQDIDGTTKSATFKREADGHWYVSLVSEFEMPDVPLPPVPESEVVGIDLGLKDFVTLSDGRRKPAERFFRKAERKLRRAAKTLSRRKRGSNRYTQARRKLARIHRRVANQRNDFVHQTTAKLVKEFSGFCIEDLSVKGMAKTKLSKSVLDAAFGEFRRQLEYKSIWHRKHLAVIDRFFPSSKLCGDCGAINTELTLGDREWTCACGAVHDRDLNAARNIKREGLSLIPTVAVGYPETKNARGDCVSPAKAGYGC